MQFPLRFRDAAAHNHPCQISSLILGQALATSALKICLDKLFRSVENLDARQDV